MDWLFWTAIALAIVYDILNGYNDGGSIIGTLVSAPILTPKRIVLFVCFFELCGLSLLFILGMRIAVTITNISALPLSATIILSSLCAAVIWKLCTLLISIPTSSSHALIGGIVGAIITAHGWESISFYSLGKILLVLLLTPVLSAVLAYLFMRLAFLFLRRASPLVNKQLSLLQFLTVALAAMLHGATEPQKTMAVLLLILSAFHCPIYSQDGSFYWIVVIPSVVFMVLGILAGGWRIAKTVNRRLMKIRPIDAVITQLSTSVVVFVSSLLGGAFSTSQVVGSSLIGSGVAQWSKQVRWRVVRNILVAWCITIPATAALSVIIWKILSTYFQQSRGALWV